MGLKPFTIRSNVQEVPPPTYSSNTQPIQNIQQYQARPEAQIVWDITLTQAVDTWVFTEPRDFYITQIFASSYRINPPVPPSLLRAFLYDLTSGNEVQSILRFNPVDTNTVQRVLDLQFSTPIFCKLSTNSAGLAVSCSQLGFFDTINVVVYGFFVV